VGWLLVGREWILNGFSIGLAFGAMGGAISAGSKALSEID